MELSADTDTAPSKHNLGRMCLSKAQTEDEEDGKRWSVRFCCVFLRMEGGKSPGSKGLAQSVTTVTLQLLERK